MKNGLIVLNETSAYNYHSLPIIKSLWGRGCGFCCKLDLDNMISLDTNLRGGIGVQVYCRKGEGWVCTG